MNLPLHIVCGTGITKIVTLGKTLAISHIQIGGKSILKRFCIKNPYLFSLYKKLHHPVGTSVHLFQMWMHIFI
jgi:hypothetical protein